MARQGGEDDYIALAGAKEGRVAAEEEEADDDDIDTSQFGGDLDGQRLGLKGLPTPRNGPCPPGAVKRP